MSDKTAASSSKTKKDAAAAASTKSKKQPLTDEQKAQAKAKREGVVWSKDDLDITAAENSRMINKNRILILDLLNKGKSHVEIAAALKVRHPNALFEPLTCEDFIIFDFITKTIASHNNALKRGAEGKRKKAEGGDSQDDANKKGDDNNNSSDDDVHVANKKADDESSKKKAKNEAAADHGKKTRSRSSATN